MHALNVTQFPTYLPADTAQVPFGDPLSDITVTAAAPGVITSPGYNATAGDAVGFSFAAGGSMPAPLVAGTTYYVVSPSNDTFQVSATKGGSAITTTTTGASLTLHLLSAQTWGPKLPFKAGASAIALNMGSTTLTLQSAPDLNTTTFGNPQGPGSYTTIAALTAGTAAKVTLNNDWISLTGSGTLVLLQV